VKGPWSWLLSALSPWLRCVPVRLGRKSLLQGASLRPMLDPCRRGAVARHRIPPATPIAASRRSAGTDSPSSLPNPANTPWWSNARATIRCKPALDVRELRGMTPFAHSRTGARTARIRRCHHQSPDRRHGHALPPGALGRPPVHQRPLPQYQRLSGPPCASSPGVIRDNRGGLHINGAGEEQILYTLNSFQVNDPLSGRFETRPQRGIRAQRRNHQAAIFPPSSAKDRPVLWPCAPTSATTSTRYAATNFMPGFENRKGWTDR
jgi:hypothetical protein